MALTPGDRRGWPNVMGLSAVAAGAAGSVGFTLAAGLRIESPPLLLVLFAAWVAFPFAVFLVGHVLSRRGSGFVQRVYGRTVAAVSLASAAAYGAAGLLAARPVTSVFVLVAPVSLLLVGLIVPTLVLLTRNRP